MQSVSAISGTHVAIIMDGNGRWAQSRGMPRTAGHLAGVKAVRRVVEAATAHGISTLSLYAFSSDNWKRPGTEVNALMHLLEKFMRAEQATCVRNGVRIEVIGRRDRIPSRVCDAIVATERATCAGTTLRLRLAIDYSSRDEMVRAAASTPRTRPEFARALAGELAPGGAREYAQDQAEPAQDVDLVIRTGGDQRLSDFLLWESAYAELYFTDIAWPDFKGSDLGDAVAEFSRRQRRYGGLAAISRISAEAS